MVHSQCALILRLYCVYQNGMTSLRKENAAHANTVFDCGIAIDRVNCNFVGATAI